jgi:hypothetical protein
VCSPCSGSSPHGRSSSVSIGRESRHLRWSGLGQWQWSVQGGGSSSRTRGWLLRHDSSALCCQGPMSELTGRLCGGWRGRHRECYLSFDPRTTLTDNAVGEIAAGPVRTMGEVRKCRVGQARQAPQRRRHSTRSQAHCAPRVRANGRDFVWVVRHRERSNGGDSN